MSTMSKSKKIRSFLAVGTVVLSLAVSTGQLTAAGLVSGNAPSSGDNSVGLGRSTIETPIHADDAPKVFAHAATVRDGLGFPAGANRSGKHVKDALQKSEYDEVDELDNAGRQISIAQFDTAGDLVAAVRLDIPSGFMVKATRDGASKAAERALAKVSLAAVGQAQVEDDPVAGGWNVHWDRVQDGFAVRGDETRVRVWQDGRIQSVAHVEHKLASAPVTQLTRDAGQRAVWQLDKWFAGRGFGYAIQGMNLEWVGPNTAFDPAKVGATGEPYRLAWVANVQPSGSISDVVRLITLYVDAGDGTVIGGDVVE